MPDYTYFGKPVTEQQVIDAAAGFGISVEEYLEQNKGFEVDTTTSEEPMWTEQDGYVTMTATKPTTKPAVSKDTLGISAPVESDDFDNIFTDDGQVKVQRYDHIDGNEFSSTIEDSNITNREDNLKRKLEEHYKDTGINFNIKNWDGNRIEIVLPGEKKGQFFDLPSDPVKAKAKYIEMVEYMEDRTAVEVGEETVSELEAHFDLPLTSRMYDDEETGLVGVDRIQEILGSDYNVKESGFFKDAIEIEVPGGAVKTFPKTSVTSQDILSFMKRNPRSLKQTKAYNEEKGKITEEAKVDLNEAITKRLLHSQQIHGTAKRTEEQVLMLLNNPESFNKMKNDILADVTSTWWTRNKDNNELKNLSNSDIDEIRNGLVQTALDNHKQNLTERLASSGEAYEKQKGQTKENIEAKQKKDHLVGKTPREIQIAELWEKIKDPRLVSEKLKNEALLLTAQRLYNEENASKPYQFNYNISTLSRPLVTDEKNKDIVNLTSRVQETAAAYEELPADALDGELFDVSIAHDQALREFKTKKLKVPITNYNEEVKYLTAKQKNKYIVDKSKFGLNAKGESVLIGKRDAYFSVTAEEAASLGLKDDLLRANATFITDLAVKKEALVRLQVLNQRSTAVGRTGFGKALLGSAAASVGIKTDAPDSQLVGAMNDAIADAGVKLTREEEKLYHKTTPEAVGEALGGLPKLMVDFAIANKVAAGVQTVTGINRLLKALNAKRYAKIVKGRKVFVKPPASAVAGGEVGLAEWATAEGLIVKQYAPHIANRAASTAITSLIEGVKMEAVLGPGTFSTGVGFGLAGKVIPWPVIRNSNWGRTLYEYGVKSPINFTIGAEAGEIMNGLTSDLMNKKDFRDFMKEHYSDYDEVAQRTIANLISGFAMRFSHISKMDFKSTQGVRDMKIEATKKRDQLIESLAPKGGVGPEMPGRGIEGPTGERIVEGKTKDLIDAQQLIIDLATKRLAELNNTEIYLDPVLGPLKLANDLTGSTNKLVEQLNKKGKKVVENVRVEYTNERIKGSYELIGKELVYTINPKYIEPGVAPHEIGHAGMELLSGKDAILKAEIVEAIDNISKDIIMDDGRTLFETVEGVSKGDKAYDVNRVTLSEKFTYLAEAMNNKQIAKQIRAKYGFDMYGQFLAKWSKKNLDANLVFNTEKRVAEHMNNYVETIRKGKSPLRNFEHLQEWISPEATKKQMKARREWEKEHGVDKDGKLDSEILNKQEQELTQEINKHLKDYNAKKITIDQYKALTEDLLKDRAAVKEKLKTGLLVPAVPKDDKFERDVEEMHNDVNLSRVDRSFFVAEMWDPTGYTNLKTGKKQRYAKNSTEAALYEKTNGEQGFKEMPAGAKALNTALKKHEGVDGFAENRDLIIEDITTGTGKESKVGNKINKARSVRQLVLDYVAADNPGVSLSAYVNTILFGKNKRYLEGVNYYTAESKIGFRTSMENAKDLTGDVNKSTYVTTEKDIMQYGDMRVAFELPINLQAFKQKGGWQKTILKNLDPTKNKSYKTTPDLAPKFTREMMGVKLTKAQEGKPNDLSQKSLEGIQNFIEAKFEVEKIEVVDGVEQVKIDPKTKLPETREVSMAETFIKLLNEGAVAFDKGVSDFLVGTSTGNRNLILNEFYHEPTKKELIDLGFKISEKTGRVETAAGLPPKVLNKNITVEQVKKFIGIDPVDGTRKTIKKGPLQDRSLAGKGRGILEIFGENVSQQEARLSDKLTVNQMFNMGAGRNRALLSEVLGRQSFENQKSFLEEVKSENFAIMLEKNKKLYPKNQTKALEKTLLDHFVLAEGHDIKTKTLKTIAKELSKEFKFTKIGVEKIRVAAAKQIAFKNILKNIEKEHGVDVYEDISKMFDKEGVKEAKVLDKILAKELIKKHGIGVYEAIMKSATSSGAGVGVFKTTADLLANDPTQRLRYSIYRNAKEVDAMIADVIRQLKSEGVELKTYKETTRAESDVQSAKKNLIKRIFDKITGEFDITKAKEQYKVGEENKKILNDALDTVLELYKVDADGNRQITSKQVRQFVEIHAGSMPGLIKKAASLAILPTGKIKDLVKKYGPIETWVLEHTTPAQYVKARIYDYILSEGNAAKKEALDLTLRDYHTTFIPKSLDTMVNKILQTNLPSNHIPGMDPIQARYYEAAHVSNFDIGLKAFAGHRSGRVYDKNITLSNAEKQVRGKEIRKALNAAMPSILRISNRLNSEILDDMKNIDKALGLGRKKNKPTKGGSFWDLDDTLFRTKSGVRYTLPNPSGKPAPQKKVIFMAGGPGSGKSSVIKGLKLKEQGFKIVNQDISLEWLMKNHGLPKDMRDFTPEQASTFGKLGWEARMIAKRKQTKFQGKGDGIIVDGTGNSLKTMQNQVREFKNKGYDIQMLFVETSLETALQRNRIRKERSLRDGIVKRTHESVQKNKEAFKEIFGKNFAEVKTDKLKQGDPMPENVKGKMDAYTKGYKKGRFTAEEFANEGERILAEGGKFDFTEFDYIREGTEGPLFNKAMKRAKKFGTKDTYILTARPHAAKIPIFRFLQARGLNIPFKNIITLENSAPEAKALEIAKKIGEGYNDIYFADDVLKNVQAVKNMIEQFDVKGKVQQALKSEVLNRDINDIMEYSLGIKSEKVFSKAEGKIRGKDKKRRKFFVPDSAADLELLLEPLYGKGKKGIENKKWFEKQFLKPWERGVNDLNTARQTILNDYMSLRKNNKDVVKMLDKPTTDTNFTNDMAARVYIWNKAGFEVPGLTKTSKAKLLEYVTNNPKLQAYAESVAKLTKIETGLKKPKETWWAETLASEVSETGRTVNRDKYIGDWIEKKNEIFSEENLNKMEAELGPKWRESIENMLDRMETGKTRQRNLGRIGNSIMNYLNGSVGAIMNLNTRSATLQLISTVNFINHAENNPLAAAKAFSNQPQYWKDFMKIMNSDMLKQRRDGLKINVTEAELAAAAEGSGNKAKKALAWILKQGYIPTKVADSFAISAGGATYYRNRIKMYEKQGLKTKEAEKKAWLDFQAIAERTQQSSRPDLLSQQQVSFEGRLILPFANTPMQMNRIMMKEILDLSKGRYKGSFGENSFTNKMSKVAYYGFVQSALFAGLQTGLFALMANSDDEDQVAQKKVRAYNTVADSFLRGMGIPGAVTAGLKNATFKFLEQNEKGFTADYSEVGEALLNISPTIGSKFSKLDAAGNEYAYNKKEILEKGLSLDNTKAIEAGATTVEAITNIPIARVIRKTQNIQGALDDQNEAWQRFMMILGWSAWDVGATKYQEKQKKTRKTTSSRGGGGRGGSGR